MLLRSLCKFSYGYLVINYLLIIDIIYIKNQNIKLYILDENKVKIHNNQNLLNNIAFLICILHEILTILHLDENIFVSDMIS